MEIIKLNSSHADMIEPLFFENDKFMEEHSFKNSKNQFETRFIQYKQFCDAYLTDLPHHHAYGIIDDDEIHAFISFYESVDEPSWYFTMVRSNGENGPKFTEMLLDRVIEHNEANGRYKFYCAMNIRHANKRITRKFGFSKSANERYDFFDEYIVYKHTKCIHNLHFDILYNRSISDVDTVVRCTFLKREYRELKHAGNL